jgi:hypothetical protein
MSSFEGKTTNDEGDFKTRQDQLYNAVLSILLRHDPLDINYGDARVEYSPAAALLSRKLRDCHCEEEVCRVVQDELVNSFGSGAAAAREQNYMMAREIWQLRRGIPGETKDSVPRGEIRLAARLQASPVLRVLVPTLGILGAAALGAWAYLHQTEAPRRYGELDRRLRLLESQKRWSIRTWREQIVTQNKETTNAMALRLWGRADAPQVFQAAPPEGLEGKAVVEAWLTDWSPRSEMLKFEEFRVVGREGKVVVVARPRPGESVSMEFWVTAIFE